MPYNTAPESNDPLPSREWTELLRWLHTVGKAGLTPYITFRAPNFCTSVSECKALEPKDSQYEQGLVNLINAINAERQREIVAHQESIPHIPFWGSWNEPDLKSGNIRHTNPLFHDAARAASLWRVAQAVFGEVKCGGCKMAAGEFAYDDKNYIDEFERAINANANNAVLLPYKPKPHEKRVAYLPKRPTIWSMHDYKDLVYAFEHRGSNPNPEASAFIAQLRTGVGGHHIWFSEQGVELANRGGLTTIGSGKRGKNPIMHVVHGRRKAETPNELQIPAANHFLELRTLPGVELVNYYQYGTEEKTAAGFEALEDKPKDLGFDSAVRNDLRSSTVACIWSNPRAGARPTVSWRSEKEAAARPPTRRGRSSPLRRRRQPPRSMSTRRGYRLNTGCSTG